MSAVEEVKLKVYLLDQYNCGSAGTGIMPLRELLTPGYVVFCPRRVVLPAGGHLCVPLEISLEIPAGYVIKFYPCVGLTSKGILSPPFVMFPGERNGWVFIHMNHLGMSNYTMDRGHRLGTIFLERDVVPMELIAKSSVDYNEYLRRVHKL